MHANKKAMAPDQKDHMNLAQKYYMNELFLETLPQIPAIHILL